MINTNFFEMCKRSYLIFTQECERVEEKVEGVSFCIPQCAEIFQDEDKRVQLINDISNFYNENWLGNKDFMHIPDFDKVLENYLKYPIVIAYRENNNKREILGISTVKYYQNNSNFINPYYPIKNNNHFEVTGVLVKKDSGIKNIGKHIYEIILESLKLYQEFLPSFDVIFVADCRNYMSINGARGGARYLRESLNKNVFGELVGFYTVRNDNNLVEAPTLVAKFNFDDDYKSEDIITFNYKVTNNLFESLLDSISNNLEGCGIAPKIDNFDGDCLVSFYEMKTKKLNLDGINIITNKTELGNDRVKEVGKVKIKYE